ISATQERLEGSLSTISSRSEFLEPEVEELKAQIVELKAELERLRAEQAQMAAPPPAPTPRKAARQSRPRTPQTPPEYRNALEAYRNGNYDESILLFQNLALSNPPPSLEDNIVFWIGNNYFQLEMYDDAIKQFETVLNNYPRGNKVHDSRYMMGLSYVRKGSTSQGIEILQSALRNNPPAEVRGKILAKLNEIQ
ncbi:MAG: tetratricopeptide repeat protein, partial [Nitrospinaceae bacterium]|nr:tetratricopeptide repeat protein [Nitrospinaceae bacterium]NIR57677.1 tetratricopeptide repeat protein [Nitrospinaceae bacterium]NIS86223.1 tetratricopeptide repeat protein [Nitrospinaceae bacterium]NIT85019.1 tetratricopeptide repeat protein [Nitrospinaceae bacterium]NIU47188.1 tetratricopeptide repeat protein [Nitrospinaceae bacterium]